MSLNIGESDKTSTITLRRVVFVMEMISRALLNVTFVTFVCLWLLRGAI